MLYFKVPYQMCKSQVFCHEGSVLDQAHQQPRSYQEEELVYVVFSVTSPSSEQKEELD